MDTVTTELLEHALSWDGEARRYRQAEGDDRGEAAAYGSFQPHREQLADKSAKKAAAEEARAAHARRTGRLLYDRDDIAFIMKYHDLISRCAAAGRVDYVGEIADRGPE
jgi:hypothetical protein